MHPTSNEYYKRFSNDAKTNLNCNWRSDEAITEGDAYVNIVHFGKCGVLCGVCGLMTENAFSRD